MHLNTDITPKKETVYNKQFSPHCLTASILQYFENTKTHDTDFYRKCQGILTVQILQCYFVFEKYILNIGNSPHH